MKNHVETNIVGILKQYRNSFLQKEFKNKHYDSDILMDFFNITPEMTAKNTQYWNRELGMVWELVTKELFSSNKFFAPPESVDFGSDRPVDYFIGKIAVDTKYRMGSGDSGTLKKFKAYAEMLRKKKYESAFLILRDDNLPAAITAAKNGGWKVLVKHEAYSFIAKHGDGIDIVQYLARLKANYF
ncbi:restriction endonuclease [Helicobacter labacensis]|uniref:restriction endonuclease n=1 Tax=Helicobacter labacensis TaxID=2316079 RepID=UPI000EB4DD2C|nr:restriction endonuclease [Helicobacter labacensis]